MRTRFRTSAGLLGFALAGIGTLGGGCDDITSGQPGEDPSPPKLLKALVLEENRSITTDILNMRDPVACNDSDKPCIAGQFGYPGGDCTNLDTTMPPNECQDPLSDRCDVPVVGFYGGMDAGFPIGPGYDSCAMPTGARPVYVGVNQIRLVFSKLLDPSVESVMIDAVTGAATYTLTPGVVKMTGPGGDIDLTQGSGPGQPGLAFWDPIGSPYITSDPVVNPFGPALAINTPPLAVGATYTVTIDGTLIHDHAGQAPLDLNGQALGSAYTVTFTVENLNVLDDTSIDAGGMLAPNDVVSITPNSGMDPTTGMITAACGATAVTVEAWQDQGPDPTMCAPNDTLIDVFPVSAPGVPMDWPMGSCTITFAGVKDDGGGMGSFNYTTTFMVSGADSDPTADAQAVANFVLPEMCMAAMGDMAMSGGDMAMSTGDMATSVDSGTD